MFFSSGRRRGGLDDSAARRIEVAAAALKLGAPRWTREGASFEFGAGSRALSSKELTRALAPGQNGVRGALAEAISLATALGVQPPVELVEDRRAARALLLPRLFAESELSGPRRAMCRREAHGGLIRAIAIGDGVGAPVVTTPMLDSWGAEFDEVWSWSTANLADRLSPESLDELEGAPGVLAMADGQIPASSGVFVLERLCPDAEADLGVVFSTPRIETLLALPVEEGAGVDGLAGLVQATHALAAESQGVLSDQIFWLRGGATIHLPMTAIVESQSRRVHMESAGPVEELLRLLGVVE
jgi:hypothetical protein